MAKKRPLNPNAPEHQPCKRASTIVEFAVNKAFTCPNEARKKRQDAQIKNVEKIIVRGRGIELQNLKTPGKILPLPKFPRYTSTPSPKDSNVGTHRRPNSNDALSHLNPKNGTVQEIISTYLEFVCDYANFWHSTVTGEDRRSAGTDPLFFCLPHNFLAQLRTFGGQKLMVAQVLKRIDRRQFWRLRYLIIPVIFETGDRQTPKTAHTHAALCVISPEAKTVDYLCSGGDTGFAGGAEGRGSNCLLEIFNFLAEYLGDLPEEEFLPFQWRLRNTCGERQDPNVGDCAMYAVTFAMCLAFGYDLKWKEGTLPVDHRKKMPCRRSRVAQDLWERGFRDFEKSGENEQYYPLLDTRPNSSWENGWRELPKEVMGIFGMPRRNAYRRECYVNCPSKEAMLRHCERNARFYPGYDTPEVSGSGKTLFDLKNWVEEVDNAKRTQNRKHPEPKDPLNPTPPHPTQWMDPRFRGSFYMPHIDPLWPQ